MKVNHIQLVLHQAKMQPLSLSVIFLSLVALGHQNYVKIYNPLNNWFEDGYLFQFGDGNEQNKDASLDQVQDRSAQSNKLSPFMMNRARPLFNIQPMQQNRIFASFTPRTSYSFTATTPTSLFTVYCTASNAFSTSVPTSCLPGARRRRMSFLETEDDGSSVDHVSHVYPSVVAVANPWMKQEVDIVSSKDDETEQFMNGAHFKPRQLRFLASTTTLTVTTVAAVVSSTTTVTIASSVINNAGTLLKCISPGGKVC